MSPHIVKASYTGARSKGQSAARLARYIEDRRTRSEGRGESNGDGQQQNQERVQDRNGDRYEKAATFGDREEFVSAAKERAGEGRRSSYVHVILSPQEGREFTDRDFEKLLKPWTQDRHGNEKEYFAAVHRDSEHPHLHVAVARDKFQKEELADLKRQTHERIQGRERFHEGERGDSPENERTQEREQGRERDSDLGRYARQGMREARYIGGTIARKAAREIQKEIGGNDHTQVQWGGYGQNGPSRLKVRIGDRSVEVYGGHAESKREMMDRAREGFHQMQEEELRDQEQRAFYARQDRMIEEDDERRKEAHRERERQRRADLELDDRRHALAFEQEDESRTQPRPEPESPELERSPEQADQPEIHTPEREPKQSGPEHKADPERGETEWGPEQHDPEQSRPEPDPDQSDPGHEQYQHERGFEEEERDRGEDDRDR